MHTHYYLNLFNKKKKSKIRDLSPKCKWVQGGEKQNTPVKYLKVNIYT